MKARKVTLDKQLKLILTTSSKGGFLLISQPCIYAIRNISDGKVYVGQTVKSFNKRKNCHLSMLRRNKHDNRHLQNSFNKYGENVFKFEILELCDYNDSDEREIYWINQYDSCNRLYGYNLESGGKNHKMLSEETKKRHSEFMKENALRGKDHHKSRMVICLDDMNIFFSVKDASDFYSIKYKNLINVVQGNNNVCSDKEGNYLQFEYYEPKKEFKKKEINYNSIKKPKKVICVNTGITYNSLREAAKNTGFISCKIGAVCNGKRGYHGKDEYGNPIKWEFV